MPRRIILETRLPPGDVCTLTATLRSLHDAFPGQFVTDVRTDHPALFENNPHITCLKEANAQIIQMHYTELLNRSGAAPEPFIRGYCHHLSKQLGIALELQMNRPDLYMTDDEKRRRPFVEEVPAEYWLLNAGVKNDFTLKQWPVEHYQALVDHFRGKVQFVQVGHGADDHPALEGVISLVGRTSLRDLVWLAYHAAGGVGPITLLQHLCAAFQKPYTALLGGREPVTWAQYPLQTTLHTLGKLPCCRTAACWKSRVVRLNDGAEQDKSLCEWPVNGMARPVGKCMAIIQPVEAVRAVEACYEGGGIHPLRAFAEHRRRLEEVVLQEHPYPLERFRGRGIVTCAGGATYLTCAYVCIRMLRHFRCRLPVQLWHLGAAELPQRWREVLVPLDVELVDACEQAKSYPCRMLGGWELKCFSIIHSAFRDVLFLDADNVPVANPEYLFDTPQFIQAGALFWPDCGRLLPDRDIWGICGVEYRDEPEVESGQMVFDKQRCWKALNVAKHLNDWSDFYYRHIHGDKETFHMAWRKLDQPYALAPPVKMNGLAMDQHDWEGRKLFQHRNLAKCSLTEENPPLDDFDLHAQCLTFLDELKAALGSPVER